MSSIFGSYGSYDWFPDWKELHDGIEDLLVKYDKILLNSRDDREKLLLKEFIRDLENIKKR